MVTPYLAPRLPGYDPHTGRKMWDASTVRAWHTHRAGQGARTDLTYLPDPHGRPVFISPTTITAAQLLLTLTDPHTTTTTKPALRQRWLQKLFDKNQTQPRPQHANGPPDTATTPTRRINNALSALEKLGGIHRDHNQITITNRIILTKITNL